MDLCVCTLCCWMRNEGDHVSMPPHCFHAASPQQQPASIITPAWTATSYALLHTSPPPHPNHRATCSTPTSRQRTLAEPRAHFCWPSLASSRHPIILINQPQASKWRSPRSSPSLSPSTPSPHVHTERGKQGRERILARSSRGRPE